MKKIAVVLISLLVLVLVLGALGCGGTKTVYVTPTPAPTAEPTPVPTASPTPGVTATPVPTVAPLKTPPPSAEPPAGGPPCRFHGTVLLNGAAAPSGTVITAIIEGYGYTAIAVMSGGSSIYDLQIPVPQGISYAGKAVTFKVGSATAVQVSAWEWGGNVVQNLTASSY